MTDEQRAENHKLQFFINDEPFDLGVKVKVVGVGDTAGSVFEHLRRRPVKDVELILANTDNLDLQSQSAAKELGSQTDDPASIQHNPASTGLDQVATLIDGANLIIIVACLGDDTAGLAQTVAASCKQTGALTIAVVTTPIACLEQPARERVESELSALQNVVDGLIHAPPGDYRRLIESEKPAAVQDGIARDMAQVVTALVRPLTNQAANLLCVDPGDSRQLFWRKGRGAFAVGCGYGAERANDSVLAALGEDGLLAGGSRLSEAAAVWVVIEGDDSLMLIEVKEALTRIQDWVSLDTDVIFSAFIVPDMGAEMRTTILAGGYETHFSDNA